MNGETSRGRLNLETIETRLTTQRVGRSAGWANELWDTIDSTNSRAAELIGQGAPEGVLVLARQQTAGRGRLGRHWESPPDSGLYASFVLRPPVRRTELPFYTIACGVAAANAIRDCAGVEVGLKWVNDLIANGKKLGGILAEIPSVAVSQSTAGSGTGLVLGIGINIAYDEAALPDELQGRIEWLERLTGQPVDCNLLVSLLCKHIEDQYALIVAGDFERILDQWRKLSVTLGRDIRAISGESTIEGRAVDIAGDGGLIVETASGQVVLRAGEISIRTLDGSYV